jgi:hypothetical protein
MQNKRLYQGVHMKTKRILKSMFAVIMAAMMLASCNVTEEPAVTTEETEAAAENTVAETAQGTSPKASETTTAQTESVAQTANDELVVIDNNNLIDESDKLPYLYDLFEASKEEPVTYVELKEMLKNDTDKLFLDKNGPAYAELMEFDKNAYPEVEEAMDLFNRFISKSNSFFSAKDTDQTTKYAYEYYSDIAAYYGDHYALFDEHNMDTGYTFKNGDMISYWDAVNYLPEYIWVQAENDADVCSAHDMYENDLTGVSSAESYNGSYVYTQLAEAELDTLGLSFIWQYGALNDLYNINKNDFVFSVPVYVEKFYNIKDYDSARYIQTDLVIPFYYKDTNQKFLLSIAKEGDDVSMNIHSIYDWDE